MSEKLSNLWRDVKDYLGLAVFFGGIALLAVVMIIAALILSSLVTGIILSVCWNLVMPAVFGFPKLTIINAIILAYAVGAIRSGYFNDVFEGYEDCKKQISEKKGYIGTGTKVVAVVMTLIAVAISLCINGAIIMYSWNTILPQLLNMELMRISFLQALCFGYVLNRLIGIPKSVKSKKEEKK